MTIAHDGPVTIDPATLERAARTLKVLGHPLRLRILEALEHHELNVAELQEATGASQALVSQQLGILRAHGVVEPRRDGGRVFYRVIEPKVSRILECIREYDLAGMAQFTTLAAFTGFEPPATVSGDSSGTSNGDSNGDGAATHPGSGRSRRTRSSAP